jgi:hypothetical protein
VWAHTARAEAEIACGRAYSVINELEELAAEHPDREPLWAELITAYYVAAGSPQRRRDRHSSRTRLTSGVFKTKNVFRVIGASTSGSSSTASQEAGRVRAVAGLPVNIAAGCVR